MNDARGILLPYQQRLLETIDREEVVVYEKSRRIGATWALGADSVMRAASARPRGSSVYYIGYNLDMAREFVDVCADWARAFSVAASEVHEVLFDDSDDTGERHIKALRIGPFASGFEIIALSSRPRSLRGRQGFVILDEAAFHDELEEMLKAAMALLIWGGKVLIISTHNGVDNAFNRLIEECRSDRPNTRDYTVLRTTFDEAIADGLCKRVAETKGDAWSPEYEAAYVTKIRSLYGDAATEELDVIPRNAGGKYLTRQLLEARTVDVPVLRWSCDDAFVDLGDAERWRLCQEWLDANLKPLLDAIDPVGVRSYFGQDFGRSGDLSVVWPLLVQANLDRKTPFTIELRNVPFRQQEQILFYLADRLPRLSGGALDARGNGQSLAEFARQRYGPDCIVEVMFTVNWYREHMPPMKTALEDATLDIPRDSQTLDDFRTIEIVNGVPRVTERTSSKDGKRHGDSAIACVLAHFASRTLDAGPVWIATTPNTTALGGYTDHLSTPSMQHPVGWDLKP